MIGDAPMARGMRGLGLAGALMGSLLALDCGKSGDVNAGPGPRLEVDTTALVPFDPALPVDTLRVASLNMSIGFAVSDLIFTGMDIDTTAYDKLKEKYADYSRGYPTDRVRAMAKEIVGESLHVVGLQEVMTLWKSDTLVNDFLPELLAAIKAGGGPEYKVFRTVLNDTSMSGARDGDSITIKFQEGNAVLVHPDFEVLDSSRQMFYTLLSFKLAQEVVTERSTDFVRVKTPKGVEFQVFNTHLEVFANTRTSQARELGRLANTRQTRSPRAGGNYGNLQIILADLNSIPGTEAHFALRDTGFADTRDGEGVAKDDGLTCCVAGSQLWDTAAAANISKRIDYVMARGMVRPFLSRTAVKSHYLTPEGKAFLASDHRMVVAHIVAQ